jgi:hypothetical protein
MEYLLFYIHFVVIDNSFPKESKKWFFYIQVKYKLIDLPQEKGSFPTEIIPTK